MGEHSLLLDVTVLDDRFPVILGSGAAPQVGPGGPVAGGPTRWWGSAPRWSGGSMLLFVRLPDKRLFSFFFSEA